MKTAVAPVQCCGTNLVERIKFSVPALHGPTEPTMSLDVNDERCVFAFFLVIVFVAGDAAADDA